MRRLRRQLGVLVPTVLLLAVLALRATDPGPMAQLRAQVFDTYQELAPRAYRPAPVTVVAIDDESLNRVGQWPWPRTQLARLVRALDAAGASAVAFDAVFAEPDRTSPAELAETWPDSAARSRLEQLVRAGEVPDHDAVFAEALAAAPSVLGFVLRPGAGGGAPPRAAGFSHLGPDPRLSVPGYGTTVTTIPPLAEAARGHGALNVRPGRTAAVVRRVPLVLRVGDRLVPSLVAESLRVKTGAGGFTLKSAAAGDAVQLESVKIGPHVVPTDRRGAVWLWDSGPREARRVPAWRVLDGGAARDLDGHVVIVGATAAALGDRHALPLGTNRPGVTVHAQLLEQIHHGQFLHRPGWAAGLEIGLVLVVGLAVLGVFALPRLRLTAGLVVTAATLGACVGGSWLAYTQARWLLDPTAPAAAGLLVYLAASVPRFLETEGERRRVRAAFAHYMAPALVERCARDPDQLRLGGESRTLSVLFCDVRNFTTLSEGMSPEALTALVNRIMTPLSEAVTTHWGTIDKYIGDALMAFWNAPVDDPAHAEHACRAALAMRQRLDTLNTEMGNDPPLGIGIGINTGPCTVGNMGSTQRFDYSALGDTVNLASRLEGETKSYGVPIVIGDATARAVPGFATLDLDVAHVKGKRESVTLHALLGDEAMAQSPAFAELAHHHAAMLAAERAGDLDQAREHLAACRQTELGRAFAGLYAVYAGRLGAEG